MKPVHVAATIGAALTLALFADGAHAVNRFGVVCIKNRTDATIVYRTQEADGAWRERSLKPGWEQSIAHRYSSANENRSPDLRIEFDSDLRSQKQFAVKYKLGRRAAVGDTCGEGAQYQFEYDRGRREFIDLKKVA